jgi:hypothetical protein
MPTTRGRRASSSSAAPVGLLHGRHVVRVHADRGEDIGLGRGQGDGLAGRLQAASHPDTHERLDPGRAGARQDLVTIGREVLGIQMTMRVIMS